MKMKRFLAAILCLAMLPIGGVMADDKATLIENTNVADVIFTKKLQSSNFDKVSMGNTEGAVNTEKNGSEAWLLDKLQGDAKAYMYFKLADAYRSETQDGSEYVLNIEYFDDNKGYFKLSYNAYGKENKIAGMTYLKGSSVWKTASFVLQDADFDKGKERDSDFSLCIKAQSTQSGVSESSIAIRRVTLTKLPQKNPIFVTATTDRSGHAFEWFSKEKLVRNSFKNVSGAPVSATAEYRLVTKDGKTVYSKTDELKFGIGETRDFTVDISEIDRCDVYEYRVALTINGTRMEYLPLELAILKTDPNGIKNKNVLVTAHLDRFTTERAAMGVDVFNLSNTYGIRQMIGWWETEKVAGVLDINGTTFAKVEKLYRDNNIYFLPCLGYGSFSVTGHHNRMPTSEAQLESYYNFCKYMAEYFKGWADTYEIGNEPNITSFNVDNLPGDVYAKVLAVAEKGIHDADPDARIAGYVLTGITYTGKDYFNKAMEAESYKYADAISLHPYTFTEPEKSNKDADIQWYKDRYAEVGQPDPFIVNSEVGHTPADDFVGTDEMQGIFNARTALLYKVKDVSDMTVLYNYERKGIVATDREDNWGMVVGGYDECEKYGTYFLPTASYVMLTGYNYLMAESDFEEYKGLDGDNVRISKFHSNKFGKKIVTLHSVEGSKNVTMKLGTDKVTVYDLKGNPAEVYGKDGVFTFTAGVAPIFIMGNIKTMEVLENSDLISFNSTSLECAQDDMVVIEMNKNIQEKCSVEVICADDMEIKEISDFDKSGKAHINIWNSAPFGEEYAIDVRIKNEAEKILQEAKVSVRVGETINSSIKVELIDSDNVNRWRAVVDIKNNSNTKPAKGYLRINSPDILASKKNISIGRITGGRTGRITFNLPEIVKKSNYVTHYEIVLDNGEIYSFSPKLDFTIAKYAEKKPVIDGHIDKNEWNMNTAMYADNSDAVYILDDSWVYGGPEDLSSRAVVMWDEENFYFCAEVTDDVFYYNNTIEKSWNGDNIQMGLFYGDQGFLALGQAGTTFHEFSIARVPEGSKVYRSLSQDNIYPAAVCDDAQVSVMREGTKTIYEMSMPWKSILRPTDPTPQAGDLLGFSYVVNENDNTAAGRLGWVEYASGIAASKDSSLFSYMRLLK